MKGIFSFFSASSLIFSALSFATQLNQSCQQDGVDIRLIATQDNPPIALIKNLWDRSISISCHITINNSKDMNQSCGIDYRGRLKKQDGFLEDAVQFNESVCEWNGPSKAQVQCAIGRKICVYQQSIEIEDCCC